MYLAVTIMLYLHTYAYICNYNTKANLVLSIELIILHIRILVSYVHAYMNAMYIFIVKNE